MNLFSMFMEYSYFNIFPGNKKSNGKVENLAGGDYWTKKDNNRQMSDKGAKVGRPDFSLEQSLCQSFHNKLKQL